MFGNILELFQNLILGSGTISTFVIPAILLVILIVLLCK